MFLYASFLLHKAQLVKEINLQEKYIHYTPQHNYIKKRPKHPHVYTHTYTHHIYSQDIFGKETGLLNNT